tara:strand:- start:2904 stop:3530 length:627 start_codon:yes stop_codon:yes gene_type:complete
MARKDINNIDLLAGKMFDEVLNNDQQTSSYDKLNAIFKKVKSSHASTDPGEYYGYLMYTMKRNMGYLIDRFGKDSKFLNEVVTQHNESKFDNDSVLYECKVHIPEISGILPIPDLKKIIRAMRRPDDIDVEKLLAKIEAQYYIDAAAGTMEVFKLIMFPSFFYYNPQKGGPPPYHICRVRFSDSIPTKGCGIYMDTLAETFFGFEYKG